jgi:hypothetical protein
MVDPRSHKSDGHGQYGDSKPEAIAIQVGHLLQDLDLLGFEPRFARADMQTIVFVQADGVPVDNHDGKAYNRNRPQGGDKFDEYQGRHNRPPLPAHTMRRWCTRVKRKPLVLSPLNSIDTRFKQEHTLVGIQE